MKKGQAVSLDLFFATAIFFIIFLAFLSQNTLNISYSTEEMKEMEMKRVVSNTANNLALTRGFPESWHVNSDANFIGLINERRVIDKNKLQTFLDMDYEKSARQLGLSGYDYYFSLEQENVAIKEKFNAVDPSYLSNSDTVVGTQRVVEYNGKLTQMSLRIYG